MVASRFSPSNPGAMRSMSQGVSSTPASTSTETARPSSAATTPAAVRASSSRPRARNPAYTGMNEADSTPSPKRFWRKLGIRNAALNASAASDVPK